MLCGICELWNSLVVSKALRSNSNTFGSISSQNDPLSSSINRLGAEYGIQALILSAIEKNDVCSLTDYFFEYTLDDLLKVQDTNGETLLMKAARLCKTDIISFLLEMDLDLYEEIPSSHWNVIHLACTLPHGVMVLSTIAEFLRKQDEHEELLYKMINTQSSMHRFTPLHFSIQYNNSNTFFWLLHHGATIHLDLRNPLTGFGNNHTSINSSSLSTNSNEGNTHNSHEIPSSIYVEPLIITTARYNRLNMFEELVERGADINCTDSLGNTPLHVACESGSLEFVVHLLEDLQEDINVIGYKRFTALHCAAVGNHVRLCKYLVGLGLDPDERDVNGLTPLHHACLLGYPHVAYALVKLGADPNLGDDAEDYEVITSDIQTSPLQSVPAGRNAYNCALESKNAVPVMKAIQKATMEMSSSQRRRRQDSLFPSTESSSSALLSESTSLSSPLSRSTSSYGSTIH